MDFEFDARTLELRAQLLEFMDTYIYPNEARFHEQIEAGTPWTRPPLMDELKAKARKAGLWNLFLPHPPAATSRSRIAARG